MTSHGPSTALPTRDEHAPTSFAARAQGAGKTYGTGDTAVVALDDVDLELPRGHFTAGAHR